MKKTLLLFIALITSVGLYSETVATPPTQGNGSEENPYQIENLAHLRWLSETNSVWDKHFIQTADIDAEETENWNDGEGFSPIGADLENIFKGTYNGDYHTIKDLSINRPNSDYQGLFAFTANATIEKLKIENAKIVGSNHIGGIVAYSMSSEIYQSSVTGSITGEHTVGGISGYNSYSIIDESQSSANIYASNNKIGGIAGAIISGTISQSSVTGTIDGNNDVGGICGYNESGDIQESFSDATLIARDNEAKIGGVVGGNNNGNLLNCYSFSNISANENSVIGGIIGYNWNGSVLNNFFAGTFGGNSSTKKGVCGRGTTYNPEDKHTNFWDKDVSGIDDGSAQAKSTAEMKNVNTFFDTDWEFKLKNSTKNTPWNIGNSRNNGYPYLNWQFPTDVGVDIATPAQLFTTDSNITTSREIEITIEVDYPGNPLASEFGVCYSLNEIPTVNDNKKASTLTIDEGEFIITTPPLELGKTYYLRDYVIYNGEITYGEQFSVTIAALEKPAGNGTEQNPYLISNFKNLLWISNTPSSWDKHFIQAADIDASFSLEINNGQGFKPIGINQERSFTGKYNGNYHKINNLTINRPKSSKIGLFGSINNAVIEKLQLANVNIEGDYNVGGIIGYAFNSTVSQTSVTGSFNGFSTLGGIIGGSYNSIIEESFTNATLSASFGEVGGIVGRLINSTVENCYSFSSLSTSGLSSAGGIIGQVLNIGIFNADLAVESNYFAGTFDEQDFGKRGIIGIGKPPNNNFWDVETTLLTNKNGDAQSKTTAEMKDINTFLNADWDFGDNNNVGIWSIDTDINDGYPYLSWINNEPLQVSIDKVYNENSSLSAIHPNPFNDVVNITGDGINRVKVYTTSGVQMLDTKYNNEAEITIPTSELDKGVYLFVIENNSNVETYRLIKR